MNNLKQIIGKTITNISVSQDEVRILCEDDNTAYRAYHMQDCCERVYVESIVGNILNILNSAILDANETIETGDHYNEYHDYVSWTRTTHTIETANGKLSIVWYGVSNGYYSETVHFHSCATL